MWVSVMRRPDLIGWSRSTKLKPEAEQASHARNQGASSGSLWTTCCSLFCQIQKCLCNNVFMFLLESRNHISNLAILRMNSFFPNESYA